VAGVMPAAGVNTAKINATNCRKSISCHSQSSAGFWDNDILPACLWISETASGLCGPAIRGTVSAPPQQPQRGEVGRLFRPGISAHCPRQ
jgi:hypothetical protein